METYAPIACWSFFLTSRLAEMSGAKQYIRQQLTRAPHDICESHIVSGLKRRVENFHAVREILKKEKERQIDDLPVTTQDLLSNVYDMGTMGQQVH